MNKEDIEKLPQYLCHKVVRAAKIRGLHSNSGEYPEGRMALSLDLEGKDEKPYTRVEVDATFVERARPQNGDYLVVYEDGYMSTSPARPFEAGYDRVPAKRTPEPVAVARDPDDPLLRARDTRPAADRGITTGPATHKRA